MSTFHLGVTFVVAESSMAEALRALPDVEVVRAPAAQSAGVGEVELHLRRTHTGPVHHSATGRCESHLFEAVAGATHWLYGSGIPCRLVGWGCQEEPQDAA